MSSFSDDKEGYERLLQSAGRYCQQPQDVEPHSGFMIQDVMDLRRKRVEDPAAKTTTPKTIEQIHKDAERERDQQEKDLMNAPQFQGPMGGMGQSRDGRLGDRRDGRDGGRGGRGGRKCRLHYSTLSEVYMMVKLESITLVLVFQAQQA